MPPLTTAMNLKNRRFALALLAMTSLCAASAFAAAPTISVFAPASGVLYSTVTITGTNFVAPVTVKFNGVASTSVTVVSSTSIKAALPPTASTGVITVGAAGGSVNSASAFSVLPGMLVSPAVGPPTTVTRLYYSGFGAFEAVDFYFDTGDIAISSASANGAANLPVTIPAAGRPGVHWVTAVGRHSGYSAQGNFTVQTSWPQVGFSPNHKGKNRYENVLSAASVVDLDQAWQTPLIASVETTPAVVNGIVYTSFNDGSIRAFDETTGAQKWSYPTVGGAMQSSPAVANGIVYAGSRDCYLYALDAVTGALKWRYLTGSYVFSSPNPVNGIVYFGSYDSKVYALNATTGALIWSYATGGVVSASPMVANGVVYVGSDDYSLYALNAATGAKIWSYATGGSIYGSAVFAGGYICVGSSNGNMYGLYAPTGSPAWTFTTTGAQAIASSAAAVGGALFFGDNAGRVYSLSSDGALLWTTALPGVDGAGTVKSPICVANGVVYATNSYYTDALDQSTGALLTALPVGSTEGGPVVVNGAVFAGDDNNGGLARYTPNALLSNYVAPRPDPMQLRPHHLR
jgi:outer membrane protein assembly factor BamB